MPESIAAAAFIIGLVLVIAALIGRDLKIAAVEVPAQGRRQRWIAGGLGAVLTLFGLLDGRWPDGLLALPGLSRSAAATAETCFPDLPADDRVRVPLAAGRRTDLKFGAGQPRAAILAVKLWESERRVGGVQFETLAGGIGINLQQVVDGSCAAVTDYVNITRPGQPQAQPYSYDTLRYRFGGQAVIMDLSYTDAGQIYLRAQLQVP